MTIRRSTIFVSCALLLVTGLSIIFYLLYSYPRVDRIFFFPKDQLLTASGEPHKIPRHGEPEKNVREYVEEWLLGPLVLENERLFPQGTRLRTLFLRDDTLYLDFNLDILLKKEDVPLSFDEIMDMTLFGIQYNFPRIQNVHIFVEGEPVQRASGELTSTDVIPDISTN